MLIVQDTDDGGAATVRFRGRIRKPRVRDDRHGRILIDLEAHGLWTRIRQAADVSVPVIIDANGKQAVDSVLGSGALAHSVPKRGNTARRHEHQLCGMGFRRASG